MLWFRMGGMWMYVVLLLSSMSGALGLAAVLAVIASVFKPIAAVPARLLSVAVLMGAAATAGAGLAGTFLGWQEVLSVIDFADPSQRTALMAQGWYEAKVPGYFGAGMGTGVALFGVVVLAASFVAPRLSRSE
jgi:hypothetical protein